MDNVIVLKFPLTLTNLAGYDYGLTIYKEQMKGKININNEYVIKFPSHIKSVASSFVQGFFSEIVNEIGLLETERHTKIESENENLSNSILKKLFY